MYRARKKESDRKKITTIYNVQEEKKSTYFPGKTYRAHALTVLKRSFDQCWQMRFEKTSTFSKLQQFMRFLVKNSFAFQCLLVGWFIDIFHCAREWQNTHILKIWHCRYTTAQTFWQWFFKRYFFFFCKNWEMGL